MYLARLNGKIGKVILEHRDGMFEVEFDDGIIICNFWELEFGV